MFLKNKNIIFKIRRSKVTDSAALSITNECQELGGGGGGNLRVILVWVEALSQQVTTRQ